MADPVPPPIHLCPLLRSLSSWSGSQEPHKADPQALQPAYCPPAAPPVVRHTAARAHPARSPPHCPALPWKASLFCSAPEGTSLSCKGDLGPWLHLPLQAGAWEGGWPSRPGREAGPAGSGRDAGPAGPSRQTGEQRACDPLGQLCLQVRASWEAGATTLALVGDTWHKTLPLWNLLEQHSRAAG